MVIGNRNFDVDNHTYIMGILNVTPDSFSDGGRFNSMDKALFHAKEMISEGVDIIDVGGESTRPGHTMISDEEEISRVVPVIERLKSEFDVPISLDTYKGKVAKAGIEAGADLINDVWGLKYDDILAGVIAEYGVPCCLMHNRNNTDYHDFLAEVKEDLQQTIDIAKAAGIEDEKIILDPGIGFGKTCEHNLVMLNNLEVLHCFNYPLLLGASRKRFIGTILDAEVDDRAVGTAATTVVAVMKNYAFVRVHDVKVNLQALKVAEAIKRSGGNIYGSN